MSTDCNRRSRILLGTVAACLLLAGCGDDDGGQEAAPTITSSTPTTAATPPTDGDEAEAVDEGGDFCRLNAEIARLFGELAQTGSEETWVDIEGVVAQMPGAAPPELEADVGAAMGYYPMVRAELEAANWDLSVLDSLELEPDHAAVEENITAYLDANC